MSRVMNMKPILPLSLHFPSLLIGILHLLAASPCRAAPPTIDDIQAMQMTVEQQGLIAFNAAVNANNWQAPVIPSRWHLDHIAPAEQRPLGEAARELGSALLSAIDAWAPLMRTDSLDEVLVKATALIDVALWVGGTEGYGNLLLAYRARDVAVVGLGRRVVDLNIPLDATKAPLQRCRAPFDAAVVRARVANYEAGAALFPTDPSLTGDILGAVWRRRRLSMRLRELEAVSTPNPTPGSLAAEVLEERDLYRLSGITPAAPDPTDAFFADERVPPPFTTRNLWNAKRHEELLGTETPSNVGALQTLIQFRETIGYFPSQPTQRLETVSTPEEEGFAEAWRPHIGSATFNLGRAAWATYNEIRTGSFLDYDSAALRRAGTPNVPSNP
jgi:hypothetical protein